jgi:hypothetical protein
MQAGIGCSGRALGRSAQRGRGAAFSGPGFSLASPPGTRQACVLHSRAQYHDSRAIAPRSGGCNMGTEAEHNRLPRCLKV